MPELPEVEIIKRELSQKIIGKRIERAVFDAPKMLRPSPEVFVAGVQDKEITAVRRRAKLLIFELRPTGFFLCHLKLAGRLFYRHSTDTADDYVHADLIFSDGTELRFADARKFGYWHYLENEDALRKVLDGYGPEPLQDLTAEEFSSILKSAKQRIKVLLMDQVQIAGVGNIYANEALWLAQIHPERRANTLSETEIANLYSSLEGVLKEGLRFEGASDQWYRHTDGSEGKYQEHFKVYGRTGQECLRCGMAIEYGKIAGRGTFWCPRCQPV